MFSSQSNVYMVIGSNPAGANVNVVVGSNPAGAKDENVRKERSEIVQTFLDCYLNNFDPLKWR